LAKRPDVSRLTVGDSRIYARHGSLNAGADFSCAGYTPGSFSDWRAANVNELRSLIDYAFLGPAISNAQGDGKATEGNPFVNLPTVADIFVRSSTPVAQSAPNSNSMWALRPFDGLIDNHSGVLLWAVRGGATRKTGAQRRENDDPV
jgi:hypothetical protein